MVSEYKGMDKNKIKNKRVQMSESYNPESQAHEDLMALIDASFNHNPHKVEEDNSSSIIKGGNKLKQIIEKAKVNKKKK